MKKNFLSKYNIKIVDWRDVDLLGKFLNPNGRILPKTRTHCSAKQQKQINRAVKRSRYMAFIPYIK